MDTAVEGIRDELAMSREWLSRFEEVEGELAATRDDVDFALVEAEMERRGIEKHAPRDHGIRAGWLGWGTQRVWPAAMVGLAAVLALWHITRRARRS